MLISIKHIVSVIISLAMVMPGPPSSYAGSTLAAPGEGPSVTTIEKTLIALSAKKAAMSDHDRLISMFQDTKGFEKIQKMIDQGKDQEKHAMTILAIAEQMQGNNITIVEFLKKDQTVKVTADMIVKDNNTDKSYLVKAWSTRKDVYNILKNFLGTKGRAHDFKYAALSGKHAGVIIAVDKQYRTYQPGRIEPLKWRDRFYLFTTGAKGTAKPKFSYLLTTANDCLSRKKFQKADDALSTALDAVIISKTQNNQQQRNHTLILHYLKLFSNQDIPLKQREAFLKKYQNIRNTHPNNRLILAIVGYLHLTLFHTYAAVPNAKSASVELGKNSEMRKFCDEIIRATEFLDRMRSTTEQNDLDNIIRKELTLFSFAFREILYAYFNKQRTEIKNQSVAMTGRHGKVKKIINHKSTDISTAADKSF